MQLVSLKGPEEATLVAQCIRGSVVSAADSNLIGSRLSVGGNLM